MQIVTWPDGVAICGEWPHDTVVDIIKELVPDGVPLVIADPPYGGIIPETWDQECKTDIDWATLHLAYSHELKKVCCPGAALYWFGGYGKPGNRVFYRWVIWLDNALGQRWQMAMHITWSKRRAYGVQHNYLSTREEIAYCVLGDIKKPRTFHVPLLDEKRGYAGYNAKYPAKSEYKRRTAVWSDVTEIFKGKVHPTEKPVSLMRIPIEVHTNPGEYVLDPFAGSGVTAVAARQLGRRFIMIEREPEYFATIVQRLNSPT